MPGDGRELVVAVPDAVTVRAEDGRRVEATDISPFISNLPFGAPACHPSLPASLKQLPQSHMACLTGSTHLLHEVKHEYL